MSTAVTQSRPNLPTSPVATAREVATTIENLRESCNVLTPAIVIDYIPPMHRVSFGVVPFGPDDVYGDPKTGFKPPFLKDNERAPNRVGLLKLLATAGGKVVSSIRVDDKKSPLICEFQVTIEIVQLDGNIARSIGTKRLDFSDGSAQIADMKEGQLKQQRQMIAELAESKALNRAIRAALQLKQKYTVQELAKPFVVPRLVPDLDTSDPAIRQLVAAKALGLTAQLFGPAVPAATEPTVRTLAAPADDDDNEVAGSAAPAATTTTAAGGPATSMQIDRDTQRKFFAVAAELGLKQQGKVSRPSGVRSCLFVHDESLVKALGLSENFIVIKELTPASADALIGRMETLLDAIRGNTAAATMDIDLDGPAAAELPAHVCSCPCDGGCQQPVDEELALKGLDKFGVKRCARCFPDTGFDIARHANVPDLLLTKRPGTSGARVGEAVRKALADQGRAA